tara:strand:- start:568 stop:867 length:300 start_codon:yes stop_codon:yes gene_type:complete
MSVVCHSLPEWTKELKESLDKNPIMILEDHSLKKPFCVSFQGLSLQKKDIFSFKKMKEAENLVNCVRDLSIGQIIRYNEYLKSQGVDVKESDLENYLEI